MHTRTKSRAAIGQYKLGRLLGQGEFGKVKFAEDTHGGGAVAIKLIDKTSIQQQGLAMQVKREIVALRRVRHPNVLKLHKVLSTSSHICLVLELLDGGEMYDVVVGAAGASQGPAGGLLERVARRYFYQLLAAVAACHAQGVCHRDVKLENLMLDGKDNLKLCDFGLCQVADATAAAAHAQGEAAHAEGGNTASAPAHEPHIPPPSPAAARRLLPRTGTAEGLRFGAAQPTILVKTTCGSPHYIAPEVLRDGTSGTKAGYDGRLSDMWSCGVVLHAMLLGKLPFSAPNVAALFAEIESSTLDFSTGRAATLSPEARALLRHLLERDPELRPDATEAMGSTWLRPEAEAKIEEANANASAAAATGRASRVSRREADAADRQRTLRTSLAPQNPYTKANYYEGEAEGQLSLQQTQARPSPSTGQRVLSEAGTGERDTATDLTKALFRAVMAEDLAEIGQLLERGASLEEKNAAGLTAAGLAAERNKRKALALLVSSSQSK